MKSLLAHARNGQIVLDQPVALPDGAVVEVFVRDDDDRSDTADERAEIEAEVDAGAADFERGAFEDAHAFATRLTAKS